jgi:hypothetical protein
MLDLKQSVTSDSDPNSDPKSFRIHNIGENKNFLAKNKNALQVPYSTGIVYAPMFPGSLWA